MSSGTVAATSYEKYWLDPGEDADDPLSKAGKRVSVSVAGVAAFPLAATWWWTVRVAARLYRMSLVSAGAGIGWRAALLQARLAPNAATPTARADVL